MAAQLNIPAGYQQVMPYLILDNASLFLSFTQKVFGATEKHKSMREGSENVIMHAEVQIGDSTIMFANSTADYPPQTAGLYVYVEDADASYEKALAAGAVAIMLVTDQSYGRSGGVKDPCGNSWWIVGAGK